MTDNAKGASYVVGGPSAWRQDCCETWPKPCQYHEGYIDAMEAAADEIERLRAEVERLGRDTHPTGGAGFNMEGTAS